MSLFLILLVIALILAILSAIGKAPLWAAVFVGLVALLVKFWGGGV